ncbi:MAG: signal peptidase II [Erysipelotrichaceae bacterium]|nr:signal peptidase II [Erysipelotrichaceae bacterium]
MFKNKKEKYSLAFIIIILSFIFDQLSKKAIINHFDLDQSMKLIGNFLSFTYVRNDGAGFSILKGQQTFFIFITIVALVAIFYLFYKEKSRLLGLAYLLILGGTLGNFADRLSYGFVIDFIHFNFWGYHFPIFNVADSFITIGAILILFTYIFKRGEVYE